MTDRSFIDTNITLYTIGQDKHKTEVARNLVGTVPFVSAQVINECISVCLRKFGFSRAQAYAFADTIMRRTNVLPLDEAVIRKSAELAIQYQLSNWDALIVAAALLADCETLYSEDMQNGQVYDGRLTIINPFIAK
jgi:predicted nucleic acid-binding protein